MSYNADSRPDGKYKMIQKNFILPDDKYQNQSSYTYINAIRKSINQSINQPSDTYQTTANTPRA